MSDKKPKNIPSGADKVYKSEGWKGWPDFLAKEKKRTKAYKPHKVQDLSL
jgi:hypothetical protein